MNEEEKKTIENDISSRLCDYVNVALKFSYRDKEKHILQTIIKELQKELDKKDKIINLIINYLAKEDVSEIFCKTEYLNIDCENEGYKCEDCIKEYFYKQMEDK